MFGGDPLGGIIDEDFFEEIQELFVEDVSRGNDFLRGVRGTDMNKDVNREPWTVRGEWTVRGDWRRTERGFIALTYFLDAFDVSWLG